MAFACDQELIAFSREIESPDELIYRWNAKVEKLMNGLLKYAAIKKYYIDRSNVSGSIQKQTNILEPDYDTLVFLDYELPDFHYVIKDFEKYLKKQSCVTYLYTTRYSLRLILDNELHIDILPAVNGVDREKYPNLNSQERSDIQRRKIWRLMEKVPWKDLPFFGSSLSEAQAEFMRTQSDFVFTVVKLLKFWVKTCLAGNGNTELNIPGLKFLTELVAVYWAQREEEEHHDYSEIHALLKIFQDLSNLSRLRIMFNNDRRVSQTKIRNIMADYAYFKRFYKIPSFIMDRGSFVIDPANPYNDVLYSVLENKNSRNHPEILQRFEEYAYECWIFVHNVLSFRQTHLAVVSGLFRNRAFSDLYLRDKYGFLLSVTIHNDYDSFMDQKSSLRYGEKTRDVDMNALDSAFQVAVAIERFQHKLHKGKNSIEEITTTAKIILNEVEAHMGVNKDLALISCSDKIRFIRPEKLLSYSRMWGGASKINFLQAPMFSSRNIRDLESTGSTVLYCITMTLVNYTKFSE